MIEKANNVERKTSASLKNYSSFHYFQLLLKESVSLKAKYNERGEILHGIHIETTARFYI